MALTPEKVEEIKSQLQGLSPEEQQAKLQEILQTLTPEEREELMGGAQQGGQCPFCAMAEGQIPVKTVYEDDQVMAILDINPASKGHVLVFLKKHYQFLGQIEDAEAGYLFKITNQISTAVFEAMGATGTNIVVNNGQGAGQTAPHVLINVIPRYENDGINLRWNPQKIEEAEMEEIAKKIQEKTANVGASKEAPAVIQEEVSKEEDDLRVP